MHHGLLKIFTEKARPAWPWIEQIHLQNLTHYLKTMIFFAALILCASGFSQNGNYESSPQFLQFNIMPVSPFIRSDSPIPSELLLNLKGKDLITGKLELLFMDGNATLAKITTDEITVIAGSQKKRIILPPMVCMFGKAAIAKGTFIVGNSRIDLGIVPIILPTNVERQICIGFCKPDNFVQSDTIEIAKNLRPECFIPNLENLKKKDETKDVKASSKSSSNIFVRKIISVSSASEQTKQKLSDLLNNNISNVKSGISGVPISLFPITPAACCAYDILIFDKEGFSYLGKKQLDALAQWILGGGAACIYLDDAACDEAHIEFFKRLDACCMDGKISAELLPTGQIKFNDGTDNVSTFRTGLGRLAILKRRFKTPEDFASEDWRSVTAFLWRVRDSKVKSFISSGKFFDLDEELSLGSYTEQYVNINSDSLVYPLDENYSNSYYRNGYDIQELWPRSEQEQQQQIIPIWFIIAIVLSYAMVAGPMDYFVLGKIKMRRLTWILFPALSIAFALLTKIYSDMRLGLVDRKQTLHIYDIGKDNSVIFHEKYESNIPGKSRKITVHCKDEIWIPTTEMASYGYNRRNTGILGEDENASFSGSLYGEYSTTCYLKQWIPEISKSFSFEAPEGEVGQKWKFPDKATNDEIIKMKEQIFSSTSAAVKCAVFKMTNDNQTLNSFLSRSIEYSTIILFLERLGHSFQNSPYNNSTFNSGGHIRSAIAIFSPRMTERLISPLYDDSGGEQTVLFVILKDKDMIKMYKKAY